MLAAVLSTAAVGSPTAPTNVMASATPGVVELAWTAPVLTQAPVITYLITIDDVSTGVVSAPTASSDGSQPEDSITGLTAGESFQFTVQARTTDGEGTASQPSNTVVALAAPPTSTTTTATSTTTTTRTTTSARPTATKRSKQKPPAVAVKHYRPHRPRRATPADHHEG